MREMGMFFEFVAAMPAAQLALMIVTGLIGAFGVITLLSMATRVLPLSRVNRSSVFESLCAALVAGILAYFGAPRWLAPAWIVASGTIDAFWREHRGVFTGEKW